MYMSTFFNLVRSCVGECIGGVACVCVFQAIRTGRVDAFVQSTDKNFLTPVGGAIIASGDPSSIQRIAATYPGRAGSGPILDLFITLLQLGKSGLRRLLDERRELYLWFKGELEKVCRQTGSRILPTPKNRISIALDLSFLAEAPRGESVSGETTEASREKRTEGRVTTEQERQEEDRLLTFFGSALFRRRCSGLRVVPCYAQPASPPPDTLSPDSSFSPRSSSSRLPPTALPGVPPSANSFSSSSSSCSSSVRVPSSCGSSATEGEVAHAEAAPSESGETHAGRDDTARQNEAGQYFFSLTPGGTLKDRKSPCNTKTICGHTFSNYGSHCETFPVPYCTVAVAIGKRCLLGEPRNLRNRRKKSGNCSLDRSKDRCFAQKKYRYRHPTQSSQRSRRSSAVHD
ncbi:O-phosphoseryl-tRNA(Sec) selenium transferase [Toxoplasma gondii FOU]|uniref:O-phosphoseryl-tRNA(Sec) selenium transferase n=1 Tax=Toxoplasma gondii FOU TaxID=943167 RepID=A0A086LI46_TOXGO|nr:O-phosphoseryl-tRNA(Sec) selenium transferase [Toxoplasma gondii FOU]